VETPNRARDAPRPELGDISRLFAIQLDIVAGILAEENAVADLDV
jgi:hypothetical protein